HHEVAVGHASREERIRRRCLLVHVRIEGVAGEAREVLDIVERDRPPLGFERIPDPQIVQRLRERMLAEAALRTAHPFPADRGEHVWGGLDRGALHEVLDTAQTAHLLTAAGATGPAVDEVRQRSAATGRTNSVANSASWVITEPTREPRPRAARATASSVSEYVMIEVTGPKASMSWTASAHGSSAWSTVAATYAPPCSAASRSDSSR